MERMSWEQIFEWMEQELPKCKGVAQKAAEAVVATHNPGYEAHTIRQRYGKHKKAMEHSQPEARPQDRNVEMFDEPDTQLSVTEIPTKERDAGGDDASSQLTPEEQPTKGGDVTVETPTNEQLGIPGDVASDAPTNDQLDIPINAPDWYEEPSLDETTTLTNSQLIPCESAQLMEAVKATNTLVEEEIAGIENAVSAANNQLSEEKVAMLDEMLVDYRSGTLNEMLSWFQRTHGVGLADVRPTFYGMRKNSGLHLNQRILNAALEKCLSDKQRTGGSLSQLVELLLWQYLGSPDEFLRPGPEPEPNPHKLRRAKTHEGE